MKQYKHITIERMTPNESPVKLSDERAAYKVENNRSHERLGYITYDRQWRKYVFSAENMFCVFSASCLRDIIQFIEGEAGKEG